MQSLRFQALRDKFLQTHPQWGSIPEFWLETWQGLHLMQALLEKCDLNGDLVELLSQCPNEMTSMYRLIHLILSGIPETYLLALNSEWRSEGYDLLTRLPHPLPSAEYVNRLPPHRHADLQLRGLGIGIDFDQEQDVIISMVINHCAADERQLIDALTFLEKQFPGEVFDKLDEIFLQAIGGKFPALTRKKALYFIDMGILPSLDREKLFFATLEQLLQEEEKDNASILKTLALYRSEFPELAYTFVVEHAQSFKLTSIRSDLVKYLAENSIGPSGTNGLALFADGQRLTELELCEVKSAIASWLDRVIPLESHPMDALKLRSVHASKDAYLNFNERDLYQLGQEDVLAAEADLATRYQDLLTNFKENAGDGENQAALYTLLPLGHGVLMPPSLVKNQEYERFEWLVEYLRMQVSHGKQFEKPIHFVGVLSVSSTHYISYVLTKMQDNVIVVYIIDPSARSHREATRCGKRMNAAIINDAFAFIFPGCEIIHLPFDQMLEGRNCGFHAYHNLDIILQTAKTDNPAIMIDEKTGVFFNLATASLFGVEVPVRLRADGEILQSQLIVEQSQQIRHQWLARLASPENCVAFECNEHAAVFRIYSGTKVPVSPLMRRIKEYEYEHAERDALVNDLHRVCGNLFSVETLLQIFNAPNELSLRAFITQMLQAIQLTDILYVFKLAIQYTDVVFEIFNTESARYMLACVYEESMMTHFRMLLTALTLEEVQAQESPDAIFSAFLEKNRLTNLFHYLSPKMHCEWRDIFQTRLDDLVHQTHRKKLLAAAHVIVKEGVAQSGAHFTVKESFQKLSEQEEADVKAALLQVKFQRNIWVANFRHNIAVLRTELEMLLRVMNLENMERRYRAHVSGQISSLNDLEKLLENPANNYTEEALRGLALKIQKDTITNFHELSQVWQKGDLKPGRFNTVFRKAATVLFATTPMISQFNRLLNHSNAQEYDSRLFKRIHIGFSLNFMGNDFIAKPTPEYHGKNTPGVSSGIFIDNRFNPDQVIQLNDFDLQEMPFGIDGSISKESILKMILFWYSKKGNVKEPDELLRLKRLAFNDSSTLVNDLKKFLKENYCKVHDPLLKDILLRLTLAKEFRIIKVVWPLTMDRIEVILRCYDQRKMPDLPREAMSAAEVMYFQCIVNRSASFNARFFESDPESIKLLRRLCQQFKKFRGVSHYDFELNIFERALLLDLVRKQKLSTDAEPHATDACYLLVMYALARCADQDPLHLFGRREEPGCFADAMALPLHLERPKQSAAEEGASPVF